jgi:hypothetical protein
MLDKRRFLAAGTLGALLPAHAKDKGSGGCAAGPGLLTIAGAGVRGNRGALDPALDQLMVRHGARFDGARVFDSAMLARLPAVTIEPTLEYDARSHRLSGPSLATVVEAAGVAPGASVGLGLRALDGYTVGLSLTDARRWGMIVATTLDGAPMSLGGLGPLWAVLDADRVPTFKDKPLKERFGLCPWGLYFVEVKAG